MMALRRHPAISASRAGPTRRPRTSGRCTPWPPPSSSAPPRAIAARTAGPCANADLRSVTRYDAGGRVERQIAKVVDGVFTATALTTDRITLYQYDSLNRVVTSTINLAPGASDPALNRVSLTAYDLLTTRMRGQRDALGRWTSLRYDGLGRVTDTTQNCRSGGGPVPSGCASYDPASPDQNRTSRTGYDLLGRVETTTETYRDGVYSAAAPDEDVTRRSSYDGLGRALATTQNAVSGGPATADTNVTSRQAFDALGRTTVMTDALGAVTRMGFNYDALGRMVEANAPVTGVVGYGYNARGERTRLTYPGGLALDYTYLADGQLDTVRQGSTTLADYTYDGVGRLQNLTRSNGATTSYSYDGADRLTDLTTTLGGSTVDQGRSIAVDSSGSAYVTGFTNSASTFRITTTPTPLQSTYGGGGYDAFVAKLNPAGNGLVYSTFLGGVRLMGPWGSPWMAMATPM